MANQSNNFTRQPADLHRIGVAGAGSMGSGIALVALYSNHHVLLYDVDADRLESARQYIESHLKRKQRAINIKYLVLTQNLEEMQTCGIIIEAIPEDLAMKQSLFSRLDKICSPQAILATNTSTLPVTAIAAASSRPERVAGMHFFNPAPVLPLVEIIAGARTNQETISTLVRLAEQFGKTPVVARDTPGFIVNRVARPFYGEALRLAGEGIADYQQVDHIVTDGGGFRMGPFRLMDLIGIDVNFAATQSMYQQTFGEPRYRPHHIQAQMVQQNALGRKTGRGFYDYSEENSDRTEDNRPPDTIPPRGKVWLSGGSWAPGLKELCEKRGYQVDCSSVTDLSREPGQFSAGLIVAGRDEELEQIAVRVDRSLPPDVPVLCQCADVTLAEISTWIEYPERWIGMDGLFVANGSAVTVVAGPGLGPEMKKNIELFWSGIGKQAIWIEDGPGLILPRMVACLANEAAFAVGEGIADRETIDRAMQLGTNYPRGPLAWARDLGYRRALAVLNHLKSEYGEERYRAAPLLKRWARFA